jgi:hypothetical protein
MMLDKFHNEMCWFALQMFVVFAPVVLAAWISFVRVVNGGSALIHFFVCWLLLFITPVSFLICLSSSARFVHRFISDFVCDGLAISAGLMLLTGWIYSAIIMCNDTGSNISDTNSRPKRSPRRCSRAIRSCPPGFRFRTRPAGVGGHSFNHEIFRWHNPSHQIAGRLLR